MFAKIEISVLDGTKDAQTLDVKISRDGVREEASMMLRGQFQLCDPQRGSMEASANAALEAIRGTLRCSGRFLTESLLDIVHNRNLPLVVSIR